MATINTDCTSNRSQNKLLYYVTHDDLLSLNTKPLPITQNVKEPNLKLACDQNVCKSISNGPNETHTHNPALYRCTLYMHIGHHVYKICRCLYIECDTPLVFFFGQQFSSFECQILMVFRISVKYNSFHSSLGHNFFYSSRSLNQFHDDFLSMCLFARRFSYWKQSMLIIWLC